MKRKKYLGELNFKELRKLPQKAIRAVQGTFDEIGLHPKQDFLEMVAKTPSAIWGFFCGIGNVIRRQYEKDMEKTLKCAHSTYSYKVQSAKYLLQEELYELLHKYITGKYHLWITRKEHIQILKSRICTKGAGKDITYMGAIYLIRIKRTCDERWGYSKQMEFYNELKTAYELKRDADSYYFGEKMRDYRPILYAGYKFCKPPYFAEGDNTSVYIKVWVSINNLN